MSKLTNRPIAGRPAIGPQAPDFKAKRALQAVSRTRVRPLRPRHKQTSENPRLGAIGTVAASKLSPIGAGQAKVGSKVRSTTAISYRDAANLLDAAAFAATIGIPLNRFLTVHTEAGGATDALKTRARLAKFMSNWVASKGGRFAHVTVRGTGEGKGEHFHMLLHIPAGLRVGFNQRKSKWLRTAGLKRAKGVSHSRAVGRFYYFGTSGFPGGGHYAANLAEALDYMLKGAELKARERLAIRRCEPGGELQGKRCFHSENIGRTARSRVLISKRGASVFLGD